jgi:hypothetical protein
MGISVHPAGFGWDSSNCRCLTHPRAEVRSVAACALRGDVNLRTGEHAGPGPGAAEIVAWRRKRLRKAGFDNRLAEQLSRECAVDLHALIELVERGCPPPLAARILAPLEHERIGC